MLTYASIYYQPHTHCCVISTGWLVSKLCDISSSWFLFVLSRFLSWLQVCISAVSWLKVMLIFERLDITVVSSRFICAKRKQPTHNNNNNRKQWLQTPPITPRLSNIFRAHISAVSGLVTLVSHTRVYWQRTNTIFTWIMAGGRGQYSHIKTGPDIQARP